MIYFLRHKESGLIKIGCTNELETRMSYLKSIYGDLELIGLTSGFEDFEHQLHEQFSHLNNRKKLDGREWFNPEQELIDFIDKYSSMNTPLPIGNRSSKYTNLPQRQDTSQLSQVRVSGTTKEVINKIAAQIQLDTGVSITADLAIRIALEKAFPEFSKQAAINTEKEIEERRPD